MLFAQSHWLLYNSGYAALFTSVQSMAYRFVLATEGDLFFFLFCLVLLGLQLCFGQAVDPELLKLMNSAVDEIKESVKFWKDDQVPSLKLLFYFV